METADTHFLPLAGNMDTLARIKLGQVRAVADLHIHSSVFHAVTFSTPPIGAQNSCNIFHTQLILAAFTL